MNLYPRLMATVTAESVRLGPYPSLRYSTSHILYRTVQDIDFLYPFEPKEVIEEDRNRKILEAATNIAGCLRYGASYDQQARRDIQEKLQQIGVWITDYILHENSLCCCNNSLPQTIEIITDQHEIPWELTWVRDKFLCQHVVLARYPYVSKARHKTLSYQEIPKLAVIVGRSERLSSTQELNEISSIYNQLFNEDIIVFEGESIDADKLRSILAHSKSYGGPFDIIHFIGHGNTQLDKVWIELAHRTPFPISYVPPVLEGNPIIFWNSCFSALSGSSQYNYQASIVDAFGTKLLSSGASHFIGPLFPVLDSTAKNLSILFYSNLFSGSSVGEALFNAKLSLSINDPIAHTYVLYGNPAIEVLKNGKRLSN